MNVNPPLRPSSQKSRFVAAFTLVEVLVSLTVLIVLLLVSAQVIGTVQNTWTASNARVSQFREARTAFDIITRNLSQATLNTYIDYQYNYLVEGNANASTAAPQNYLRKSDLRFMTDNTATLLNLGDATTCPGHAVFFQAPLGIAHDPRFSGLDRLLCGRGYFVQFTDDTPFRPSILPPATPRYRYRLMEFSPPAEKNLIYPALTDGPPPVANTSDQWYQNAGYRIGDEDQDLANRGLTRPIADNIVALIIAPMIDAPTSADPNAKQVLFKYDSTTNNLEGSAGQGNEHLLPPQVRVILVAMDERSADRLSQQGDPTEPPLSGDLTEEISKAGIGGNVDFNLLTEKISTKLRNRRVNFRIFSATVTIRGAKLSN